MSTLYFLQNNGIYIDEILNQITDDTDTIVLLGQREWALPEVTKEFVDILKRKNIDLKIVHGSFNNDYYVELYRQLNLPIENVSFFGTYWLKNSYQKLIGSKLIPENYIVNRNFKHSFICLNNRSHFHRCVMIDELAKQNMLDKGVVTWVKHLNENSDYTFQYYDGSQRLLDDEFVTKLDSFLLPTEWHESLLHMVTECTSHVYCVSEKTCIPILLKKPFLVLGARGFTKNLVDMGFVLYDEVFDYSFDDEPDLYKRTELLVNNLHKLKHYDLSELYKELYPKIYHNYEVACKLIMDNSSIPQPLLDYKEKASPQCTLASEIDQLQNTNIKKAKFLSIWAPNESLDEKEIENVNHVIIDQTVEFQYNQLQTDLNGVEKVINLCRKHNVPVSLLTCSHKYNKLIDNIDDINIVDNPAFWIAKTLYSMLNPLADIVNRDNKLNIINPNQYQNHTKLYITMNNLIKLHRCRMMDMLAKYDLIDNGNIAWRDVSRQFDGQRPFPDNVSESILAGFKFDYWTPKKMFLDFTDNGTSFVNQNILPREYASSFLQIVAESDDRGFLISEKTAVPLLFNKPFIVIGSKDFHKNLVDMGFVLYDEVFDYSFDSIDDMDTRVEETIKTINNLKNYSTEQLNELYISLLPKLQFNRQIALNHVQQVIDQYSPYVDILQNNNINCQLSFIHMLKNMNLNIY